MATFTRKVTTPCTWASVKEIIETGRAAQEFKVGDEFAETLTTGEEVIFVVAGIDVYAENQVIFTMKDCLANRFYMNSNWTNKGGWLESEMRTHLNTTVFEALPDELRSVITPRTNHSSRNTGEDNLWLFSEFEIFGETIYAKKNITHDKHLPYYQEPSNRRKRCGKETSLNYWWLRSPNATSTTNFCYVHSSGTANYYASYTNGVAAGFCI